MPTNRTTKISQGTKSIMVEPDRVLELLDAGLITGEPDQYVVRDPHTLQEVQRFLRERKELPKQCNMVNKQLSIALVLEGECTTHGNHQGVIVKLPLDDTFVERFLRTLPAGLMDEIKRVLKGEQSATLPPMDPTTWN